MVPYLGSLVQWCWGEGGTLQTVAPGGCGGARSAWASPGLPRSGVCDCLVALRGRRLKRPRVACTSQVLGSSTEAQAQLGLCFVPFPGPSSSGNQVLGEGSLPRWAVRLITSPVPAAQIPGPQQERPPRRAVRLLWGADLWLPPSWWMSTAQDPTETWLATGSLLAVWWTMRSLGQSLPVPSGSGCCPPGSLPPAGHGPGCSPLALLRSPLSPSFCGQRLSLEPFMGKFSLSLSPPAVPVWGR